MAFQLQSNYIPSGDQPTAIKQLTEAIVEGDKFQTLLGVTGSGKTFTMEGNEREFDTVQAPDENSTGII